MFKLAVIVCNTNNTGINSMMNSFTHQKYNWRITNQRNSSAEFSFVSTAAK